MRLSMENQHLFISGMSTNYNSSSSEIIVPDLNHRSEKLIQILKAIPDADDSDKEDEIDTTCKTLIALKNSVSSSHQFESASSKTNISELNDTLNNLDQLLFSLECSITDKLEKLDAREIEINAELKELYNQIEFGCTSVVSKNFLSCFGMPYFKTHKFHPFPSNEDDLTKKANDELITYTLSKSSCWTSKEISMIQKAVADYVIEEKLEKLNSHLKTSISDPVQRKEAYRKEWALWNNKPLEELVPNPDQEFDWSKISIYTFRDRHTSEECKRIWHEYAKPSIVKTYWSKEEDNELKHLVKIHNDQNWDAITKELNTGRSRYQCLVQYRKRLCRFKRTGKWTEEEDSLLCKIVNHCRIGSYIPWGKVMYYFDNRSLRQVFNRWSYSLNPALKKGPFTRSEDFGLCVGVQLYGQNFCKIASILGNRSAVQIRERFKSKMNSSNTGGWTKEEDRNLIDLFNKYGDKKWSQISKHLNRNRTQCRLRYSRLKNKYNFDLDNIKRTVKFKPLHTYEKGWFKEYFSANGDEKSLRTISKNLSLIKKRGPKGRSGTVIENQIVDFFMEAYSDNFRIFRTHQVKDEGKLEESAKALKNLLTFFKARINFPKNLTAGHILNKDTHMLTDNTLVQLILRLAKLYDSEDIVIDHESVAVPENSQTTKKSQSKIVTRKGIDYNPANFDEKSTKVDRLFLRPKKTYNRASLSNLIHKKLDEFYVEPQPKNFFYKSDFCSALTNLARENFKSMQDKSNSSEENERISSASDSKSTYQNICTFTSAPASKPTVEYLFPPNILSLIGLRTLMLARKKLWKMLTKPILPESYFQQKNVTNNSSFKLSFDEAHKLAVSRCASLLFWPLFLSDHSPSELGYSKPINEDTPKVPLSKDKALPKIKFELKNFEDLSSDDEDGKKSRINVLKQQSSLIENETHLSEVSSPPEAPTTSKRMLVNIAQSSEAASNKRTEEANYFVNKTMQSLCERNKNKSDNSDINLESCDSSIDDPDLSILEPCLKQKKIISRRSIKLRNQSRQSLSCEKIDRNRSKLDNLSMDSISSTSLSINPFPAKPSTSKEELQSTSKSLDVRLDSYNSSIDEPGSSTSEKYSKQKNICHKSNIKSKSKTEQLSSVVVIDDNDENSNNSIIESTSPTRVNVSIESSKPFLGEPTTSTSVGSSSSLEPCDLPVDDPNPSQPKKYLKRKKINPQITCKNFKRKR